MKAAQEIVVPISRAVKQAPRSLAVTVKLSGVRRFKFRLRLCLTLLKVACWIAPMKVDVEVSQ
jgi:hypothetical protein